jgi:diguanylate cyclase (GGDEF)-like protein/hemerythrin-like metal-binding protein
MTVNPFRSLVSISHREEAYLRAKREALAPFSIRMCLLVGGTGFLLWIWDWNLDPAEAWHTLYLRGVILAAAFLYPAALKYSRNPGMQAFSAFATTLSWLGAFFGILTWVKGGMVYGIGGFMLFQLMGILLLQGLSFRLKLLYDILIVFLPHLFGLIEPALGFPHLTYAVLIWPTAAMTALAQFSLDKAFRRQYDLGQALEDAAFSDPLTGAWNRRYFGQMLPAELAKCRRYTLPMAIVMMDIDHFKRVNDTFGHRVGDEVLREIAEVMRRQSRVSDVLIRWGGEEFLMLLPATTESGAMELAEKIRKACEQTEIPPVGHVTLSFGVAEYLGEATEAWIKRADDALYEAKAGGRNRVVSAGLHHLPHPESPALLPLIHMPWRDTYALGHPVIDAQHKAILNLSNKLLDLVASEAGAARIEAAMKALQQHIKTHFSEEERILAGAGYPQLELHRQAHRYLLETTDQMEQNLHQGETDFRSLLDFLINRVVKEHLLQDDMAFKRWVNGQGTAR